MKALGLFLAFFFASATHGWADTIHLKNGGTLEGIILKQNEDGVLVLLKYARVTVNSFDIASIERPAVDAGPGQRIADWQACFRALAGRPWGGDLRLLPSPVMDSGDLKNVPYVVHASDNYEFVLYGDPDKPARVEIGLSGSLLGNDQARKECIDLAASFLRDADDVAALRSLAAKGEKKERAGLILEIDQEPDWRGKESWWVSLTDPRAVEDARVPDHQVASLTTSEAAPPPRNPTLVEKGKGKGQPQEVITPFGTEPEGPHKKRKRSYGGGGSWGRHLRWNHGHATPMHASR